MKHAYLIEINTNFSILNRLLEFLDDTENDFYIMADRKVRQSFESLISYTPTHSRMYELPGITISWGAYSSSKAVLMLLRYARTHGHYDYFHYMQGSDFPIRCICQPNIQSKDHRKFSHFIL